MDLAAQAIETWQINDRLNRYLLDNLPEEQLEISLSKGKSVRAQFSHIHNVRVMWLKPAAPELLEGLSKLEGTLSRAQISEGLAQSGMAISKLFEKSFLEGGKVKNFRPHGIGFLGYLIAHEAHHRGQIEIALRQAGLPLSDKLSYGLWEWGVR